MKDKETEKRVNESEREIEDTCEKLEQNPSTLCGEKVIYNNNNPINIARKSVLSCVCDDSA